MASVFRYPTLSRHNDVDVRFLQVFVCSGTVNGLIGQQAERTVVDPERKLVASHKSGGAIGYPRRSVSYTFEMPQSLIFLGLFSTGLFLDKDIVGDHTNHRDRHYKIPGPDKGTCIRGMSIHIDLRPDAQAFFGLRKGPRLDASASQNLCSDLNGLYDYCLMRSNVGLFD